MKRLKDPSGLALSRLRKGVAIKKECGEYRGD
jgi:hypothetical protein